MSKVKRRRKGCGCLPTLILVAALIFVAYMAREQVKEYFFPRDYENTVEEICAAYGMDHWLIMAMIREESDFQADAVSPKGASGLMQLMPDTAEWVIGKAGFAVSTEQALTDPYWNISLGVWYIDWLDDTYYGSRNLTAAIAAYNAGHTNVDEWLASGAWDGTLENINDIPFAETRQYVQYVYKSYQIYRQFYE